MMVRMWKNWNPCALLVEIGRWCNCHQEQFDGSLNN